MIIFNGLAVIQGLFALLPAVLVGAFFSMFGADPAIPGAIAFLASCAAMDAFMRHSAGQPSYDDLGEPTSGLGFLAWLLPWKGGHLFFLPNWMTGSTLAALLSFTWVMSLFSGA